MHPQPGGRIPLLQAAHGQVAAAGIWYNTKTMAEEKTPEPVRVPKLAMVLTAIAWFWTAYECDTIGIDVFDMLLKR